MSDQDILILAIAAVAFFAFLAGNHFEGILRKALWNSTKHAVIRNNTNIPRFGLKQPVSNKPVSTKHRRYYRKAMPLDAKEQLTYVAQASFSSKPLLNKQETKRFVFIESILAETAPEWRIMAQVNLGEILSSSDKMAFSSINSKRVDMLIVDQNAKPIIAIEYQGEGHFQGNAVQRDAVKAAALLKGGIRLIEIFPNDTKGDVRKKLGQSFAYAPDQTNILNFPNRAAIR
jgi:hypothetical protein